MKGLIRDIESAIGIEYSAGDRADEDGVTTFGYFDGLFFRIDLLMETLTLPRSRRFD